MLRRLGRCCGASTFHWRLLSSGGLIGDAVADFILPHTAVKSISRYIHSPHKISPRDTLGSPFPIKLLEFRPVGGDRFLPLCTYPVP